MCRKLFTVAAIAFFLSVGMVHAESGALPMGVKTPPQGKILIPLDPAGALPKGHVPIAGEPPRTFQERFDKVVWPLIQEKFVREFPDTAEAKEKCLDDILKGGLPLCLDDPHSHYIPQAEAQASDEDRIGRFAGVGFSMAYYKNQIMITGVLDDSPAQESGKFYAGDIIIEVNGESIAKKPLEQIIKEIRGDPDTTVTLRVSRAGVKLDPVTLTRREIVVQSVRSELIDERTVLIRIGQFAGDTSRQFLTAVAPHVVVDKTDGSVKSFEKDFVLDLRGNPGGLLNVVQEMSCLFAEKPGDIIVTTKSRDGEQMFVAGQCFPPTVGLLREMHFVVLADHYSASAAEIFTGLIQDYKLAKIVGTKTFGKGSVQIVIPLFGGGEMALTVAEYFVGNGKVKVNGVGITPDVEAFNAAIADVDEDEEDIVKLLKDRKLADPSKDKQLRAALKVLHGDEKKVLRVLPSLGR